MADSGLEFLKIGYTAIWLVWFLFAFYLLLKHNKINKDLTNLKSVMKLKKTKHSNAKSKFIIFFVVVAVVAFSINGMIYRTSPPEEPFDVSEFLKDPEDYDKDENIKILGTVGEVFPGENNSFRFKFDLIDLTDKNQTVLINTSSEPEGFEKDKKIVVTGTVEIENESISIKAKRIDVGYPSKFQKEVKYIYIAYSAVWLGLFALLITLNLKQSELEMDIAELEEKVSSHGRKRKK